MASQLSHVYAANRIAAKPFDRVFHTSFSERSSPRLHAKLVQHSCYAWSRTSWFPDGLDEFRNQLQGTLQDHSSDKDVEPILLEGSGRTLVYLSADAEEQLDTLKEEEVYIIGGLVDRNRHKVSRDEYGVFILSFYARRRPSQWEFALPDSRLASTSPISPHERS